MNQHNRSIDPDLAAACGAFDLPQSKVAAANVGINDHRQQHQPDPRSAIAKRTFTPLRDLAKKHPGSKPMMVRYYFPASSIFIVFGEPGSGKTTVVVDVIGCIDTGIDWRGRKVTRGIVWYIAAEDPYGVRLRLEAWYDANGFIFERDTNIELREDPICFAEPEEVSALIAEVNSVPKEQKPIAITLDTLADTAGKYDFNKDMGLFCRGFERFRNETGVSLIIIHHCGHAAKDRPRNGSELGGKADVIMPVKCEDGITTLSVIKLKNGSKEKTKPLSWKMKGVTTKWLDADGEVITSVILEPTDDKPDEPEKPEYLPKAQRIAMDALRTALMVHGIEDKGVVSVAEDQWREAAYAAGVSSSDKQDTRKKAFNRCKDDLVAAGKVSAHEGRFWVPKPTGTKRDKTGHCPDLSGGFEDGDRDITGHIPLGMSRCVPPSDNPDIPNFGGNDEDLWIGGDEHPDVEAQPSTDGR